MGFALHAAGEVLKAFLPGHVGMIRKLKDLHFVADDARARRGSMSSWDTGNTGATDVPAVGIKANPRRSAAANKKLAATAVQTRLRNRAREEDSKPGKRGRSSRQR